MQRLDGTCNTVVTAPGFDTTCKTRQVPYRIDYKAGAPYDVGSIVVGSNGITSNPPGASGNIEATTSFKPDGVCADNLVSTNCELQISKVHYPIRISNGTDVLPPRSASLNDTLQVQYPDIEPAGLGVWPSTIGGMTFAAETMHASIVSLSFTGALALQRTGPMGSMYLNSNRSTYGRCDMTWVDPTPDVLTTIRELMFRSAISISNNLTLQTVPPPQPSCARFTSPTTASWPARSSSWLSIPACWFRYSSAGADLAGPSRSGRSRRQRRFVAPLLRDSDCNGDIDKLLNGVRQRRARSGAVGGGAGEGSLGVSSGQGVVHPYGREGGKGADEEREAGNCGFTGRKCAGGRICWSRIKELVLATVFSEFPGQRCVFDPILESVAS